MTTWLTVKALKSGEDIEMMPYIFVRFVFFVWYAKHPPVAFFHRLDFASQDPQNFLRGNNFQTAAKFDENIMWWIAKRNYSDELTGGCLLSIFCSCPIFVAYRCNSFWNGNYHQTRAARTGGRVGWRPGKNAFGASQITLKRQEADHVCQSWANRHPLMGYRMDTTLAQRPRLTHIGGRKVSLSNFRQPVRDRRKCQHMAHMRIHWLAVKWRHEQSYSFHKISNSKMSERRSSSKCAFVERPDRHCGDDLVQQPAVVSRFLMLTRLTQLCWSILTTSTKFCGPTYHRSRLCRHFSTIMCFESLATFTAIK